MRDCDLYHGWLVGVPINNPASVTAWADQRHLTAARIWGVGGVASDGTNPFVTTGNTFNTGGTWSGGEAVIRFQPGPIFSGNPSDYWAPTNWLSLDNGDHGSGWLGSVTGGRAGRDTVPVSSLQWAKMAMRICLIADNLGGISAPVASLHVTNS